MLIFIKTQTDFFSPRVAVPLEKVFSIIQHGETIEILAQTGDTEIFDPVNGGSVAIPSTKLYIVKYSNEVAAAREMTSFYYSCQKGDGAFLFTDAPESFEID